MKGCKFFGIEFEEHSSCTWVFIRTWEKDSLRRVCVAVLDRYFGDASTELTVLGRILSSVPSDCKLVSLVGGSHTLVETYTEFCGSGKSQKIVDYPLFDLRLLKRCLQKSAAVVFGSMDPFSMTEFLIVRLKGAVHRDWMQTRPALRKAIETGELSMPSLLEVVSNIVGVWPLIVSYLKVTGKRDSKDSLVVSICRLLVRLGGFVFRSA